MLQSNVQRNVVSWKLSLQKIILRTDSPKKRCHQQSVLLQKVVISGGQTGADRAGLEAPRDAGIETGGFAPQGFLTSNGTDATLESEFGLVAVQQTSSSLSVGQQQAAAQIIRLVIVNQTKKWQSAPRSASSSSLTAYRQCLVISNLDDVEGAVKMSLDFVSIHNPRVLNVCAHRNDETAGRFGFTSTVRTILTAAFKEIRNK